MRTLKFHYAGAWNFLCYGPQGIEIFFDKLGNIVSIRGENLDTKPISGSEDTRISSNGTGKSSIPEILCYGLYGKTIKAPSKIKVDDVINNIIGEDCKIEIIVDDLRILRCREPNSLELWESPDHVWDDTTKIADGLIIAQNEIEKKLPLSYEGFVNVVVFSDDSKMAFLECESPKKREIVENLMSLDKYREWHKETGEIIKELKKSLKSMASEYEILLQHAAGAVKHAEQIELKEKQWATAKAAEITVLEKQIVSKKHELESTDTGAALLKYQEAQEQVKELSDTIEVLEKEHEKKQKLSEGGRTTLDGLKEKARTVTQEAEDLQRSVKDHLEKIANRERVITELQSKKGTKCPVCYGKVEECNFKHVVQEANNVISASQAKIEEDRAKIKALTERITVLAGNQEKTRAFNETVERSVNTLASQLRTARKELVEFSQVREPKAEQGELLLEQQLAELKNQLTAKKQEAAGPSPFLEILDSARTEVIRANLVADQKKQEIEDAESQMPYYEYWLKAFGDNGIRKWVIDGIIPALNSRISYWLQFLIDNKIQLRFDNQLKETIERVPADGDPFVYHAMSGGERRRLNLAVSQAFAHIMMMNTGAVPSLVFLDEVSTNIDPVGIQGIYKMICELSQDKQVFVTTHDHDLLKMLDGCHTINLLREKGITRIVNPGD